MFWVGVGLWKRLYFDADCPEISGRGVARLLMVSGQLVFLWYVAVSRMDI